MIYTYLRDFFNLDENSLNRKSCTEKIILKHEEEKNNNNI